MLLTTLLILLPTPIKSLFFVKNRKLYSDIAILFDNLCFNFFLADESMGPETNFASSTGLFQNTLFYLLRLKLKHPLETPEGTKLKTIADALNYFWDDACRNGINVNWITGQPLISGEGSLTETFLDQVAITFLAMIKATCSLVKETFKMDNSKTYHPLIKNWGLDAYNQIVNCLGINIKNEQDVLRLVEKYTPVAANFFRTIACLFSDSKVDVENDKFAAGLAQTFFGTIQTAIDDLINKSNINNPQEKLILPKREKKVFEANRRLLLEMFCTEVLSGDFTQLYFFHKMFCEDKNIDIKAILPDEVYDEDRIKSVEGILKNFESDKSTVPVSISKLLNDTEHIQSIPDDELIHVLASYYTHKDQSLTGSGIVEIFLTCLHSKLMYSDVSQAISPATYNNPICDINRLTLNCWLYSMFYKMLKNKFYGYFAEAKNIIDLLREPTWNFEQLRYSGAQLQDEIRELYMKIVQLPFYQNATIDTKNRVANIFQQLFEFDLTGKDIASSDERDSIEELAGRANNIQNCLNYQNSLLLKDILDNSPYMIAKKAEEAQKARQRELARKPKLSISEGSVSKEFVENQADLSSVDESVVEPIAPEHVAEHAVQEPASVPTSEAAPAPEAEPAPVPALSPDLKEGFSEEVPDSQVNMSEEEDDEI